MGTTTPHGLPYPENSDLVTQGAAAIQALAEAAAAKIPQDTGLRDIKALATSSAKTAFPSLRLYVRRFGPTVEYSGWLPSGAGGALQLVDDPTVKAQLVGLYESNLLDPTGLRKGAGLVVNDSSGLPGGAMYLTSVSGISLYGLPAAPVVFTMRFNVSSAWPATLPGIAA